MSIDPTFYRQVVGCFATGVTVITTGDPGSFHGMTASSFTSVSLEPTLVLVCVENNTQTMPLLRDCKKFAVNILSDSQEGLSRAFARRDSAESNGLVGVDYRLGELGLPLLNQALAFLECRLVSEFPAGDHAIFVGEVVAAGIEQEGSPLVYFRSRYRQIADPQFAS